MKLRIITIALLSLLIGCDKKDAFIYHTGTLVKESCTSCSAWLVILDDEAHTLVQPLSINANSVTIKVGQKVRLNYTNTNDYPKCNCFTRRKYVKLISIKNI